MSIIQVLMGRILDNLGQVEIMRWSMWFMSTETIINYWIITIISMKIDLVGGIIENNYSNNFNEDNMIS